MKPGLPVHDSAKQRALRIPLEYLSAADRVQRWKWAICLIVVLITAGYGIWVVLGADDGEAFSHGPVAKVHAAWDANCSACHFDFVALREDAANPLSRFGIVSSPQGSLPDGHLRADQKCQMCHLGPIHHDNELAVDAKSCVTCHTDHRGRNAEIARPKNSHCTRCHSDIVAHRAEGRSQVTPPIENVTQFAASSSPNSPAPHPTFRSLMSDPGNVKFNHAMHMTAGIPARDPQGQGKKLLTWEDLREFADQYRDERKLNPSEVQLACSSCHQTDAKQLAANGQRRIPATGAYMLPVRFDLHCQACHHLNYEAGNKKVQHGLRPVEVRAFLSGRYLAESNSDQPAAATKLIPRRQPMGGSLKPTPTSPTDVLGKVAAAERYVRDNKTCEKCHLLKTSDPSTLGIDVQDANIPQVWFQHARFDHSAHGAVKCAECHAEAYAQPGSTGQSIQPDHDRVMICQQDVCLMCHARRSETATTGGARYDCVECHRFHGADLPALGKQVDGHQKEIPLPQRLTIDGLLRAEAMPARTSDPKQE